MSTGEDNSEVENPRVAAGPSLRVRINSVIISTKQDVSDTKANSKTFSSSSSVADANSNHWDVSASAKVGYSITGPSVEVSVTGGYGQSNTHTASAEISQSTGVDQSHTYHLNTGEAGYIGLNVTYENVGTDTIKYAKPHFNIGFEGKAPFLSLSAKNNNAALSLEPGKTKTTVITANDDFNAQIGLTLNQEKIDALLKGATLTVQLSETEGYYGSDKKQWSDLESKINPRTARITLITSDGKMYDRRVACKGTAKDTRNTPDISLKDAIKLAFNGTEKNNVLTCKGLVIDNKCSIVFDDKAREGVEALTGTQKEHLAENLMLRPGMGIIIKPQTTETPSNNDNTLTGSLVDQYDIHFEGWMKQDVRIDHTTMRSEVVKGTFSANPDLEKYLKEHKNQLYFSMLNPNNTDMNIDPDNCSMVTKDADKTDDQRMRVLIILQNNWYVFLGCKIIIHLGDKSKPLFQKTYQRTDKIEK